MTTTQPNLDTPRLQQIRAALAIDTTGMGRPEIQEVWKMTHELSARLTCELWGAEMGWEIPPFGSAAWLELHAAWLESEDDE